MLYAYVEHLRHQAHANQLAVSYGYHAVICASARERVLQELSFLSWTVV